MTGEPPDRAGMSVAGATTSMRGCTRGVPAWFVITSVLVGLLKLWATSQNEIAAVPDGFDRLRYAQMAQSLMESRWLGPYDEMTLIRRPGYPIWIWLVSLTGIPLRVAMELLLVAAAWAFSAALIAARLPSWLSLVCQFLIVWFPQSLGIHDHLLSDAFYGPVLILSVASAIGILVSSSRRRSACSVATGITLAVLWQTRPEVHLLLVHLAVLFGIVCLLERARGKSRGLILKTAAAAVLPSLVLVSSASLVLRTISYSRYGIFQSYELLSPSFWAATQALVRIRVDPPRRYVSVPREARELAYGVSPSFAELRPFLTGLGIAKDSCRFLDVCDDYADGWFLFALRGAAARAGHHRSARQAEVFYRRIAGEIQTACRSGSLPCLGASSFYLRRLESLRYLPEGVRHVARLLGSLDATGLKDSDHPDATAWISAVFDRVAGRRAQLTAYGTAEVAGWAFGDEAPIARVFLEDPEGRVLAETSSLTPRRDVVRSFEKQGRTNVPERTGFHLHGRKLDSRTRLANCKLVFGWPSGQTISVPAAQRNGTVPGLHYQLDIVRGTESLTPSRALVQRLLARGYHPVLILVSCGAGLSLFPLLVRRRHLSLTSGRLLVLLVLAEVVFLRLLLFSYVEANHFHTAVRYVYPVAALYLCTGVILIEYAGRILARKSFGPENRLE